MPGTRYDRFLDMHLVAPRTAATAPEKVVGQNRQHKYDFQADTEFQRNAYQTKHGLTAQNAKVFGHVLGENHVNATMQSGLAGQTLESMRYIACYVALESLRPEKPLISDLQALVEWVSAEANNAGIPTKGKLRLNCHGSFKDNAGLKMGGSSVSPDEMVDALIRHGLARKNQPDGDAQGGKLSYKVEREAVAGGAVPMANFARWKADAEVTACENTKCRKAFTVLRRKHHCRRCGGIYCDACTTKRMSLKEPLMETGRAKGTVDACRVCDDCFSKGSDVFRFKDVKRGIQLDRGLVQITLGMCLSARNAQEFATMEAGFARNSIAARLVKRLSMKGIHGIKVTGSNEVVFFGRAAGQLNENFAVTWPGCRRDGPTVIKGFLDDFEGIWDDDSGWLGLIGRQDQIRFPSSLLGTNGPGTNRMYGRREYQPIQNQKIVPIRGGNALAFGFYQAASPEERLVNQAFDFWQFTSWRYTKGISYSLGNDLNRLAMQLDPAANGGQAGQRRTLGFGPQLFTIVLDAPQRNITIKKDPADPDNQLIVSGVSNQRFKDHKFFAVT
jgi:hypothetical protein